MEWFNPFEGGGTGGGGSSADYATSLVLELNSSTYVLTATLKNKNGNILGTPQTIDLPLETMVVSGRYDSQNKNLVLVLDNGQEITIPIGDLISGLQAEITVDNKLDIELIDCEGSHYKVVWVGTSTEYAAAASSVPEGIPVIKTDDDDIDQIPTENSENLVPSGGIYSFVVQGLANKVNTTDIGTAAAKDVPVSGNAGNTEVVMGNDTRLTDARPASDVSDWAKALTKPAYDYSEIGNAPAVDATPTSGSHNLVESGGVYTELDGKVDKVNGKQLSTEDYTAAEKIQLATNTSDIADLKADHVELTQAEYNAIGLEKYTDNKEYFITDAAPDDPTYIYGFHIDPDESDSYDCVTYLADAVGMTRAAMGTTAFNYGSWENAFFMPKPCMLKFDGTVDYYLDPNDYSKKVDGTASDVGNLAYDGNAMMEFPLIWYKFVQGVANGEGYFYVSNKKVDSTYKCWSNMDCDGNIIDHFYMPIYNGATYDEKMRSISGITLAPWSTTAYSSSATYAVGNKVNYNNRMWKCTTAIETAESFDPEKWEQFAFNGNTSGTEEIAQATANNTTAKVEWYIDQWCDRVLINGLLVLISKSIDTQGAFGRGIDTGSQVTKESYVTGSLNNKGLFYGSTANGSTAVKVFGMENWWALEWRRTAGLIGGANNTYLYKLTASTADGSTASAYNTNGSGYFSTNGKPASSNYVKQMKFGAWGWLPFEVGAYSTQYYKDYYYSGTGFALVGGSSYNGANCGAFAVYLSPAVSVRAWNHGAAPSCKPCSKG